MHRLGNLFSRPPPYVVLNLTFNCFETDRKVLCKLCLYPETGCMARSNRDVLLFLWCYGFWRVENSPCTWNEFWRALTGPVTTQNKVRWACCGAHQPCSEGKATNFTGLREKSIIVREVMARNIFLHCLSIAWWFLNLLSGKCTRSVVKVNCSWFKPTALMRWQNG